MINPFRRTGVLEIGKEYPPKWESGDFQAMITELKADMEELYPVGQMPRQAHPKMHGLLVGEFVIEENLPQTLKVGVFAAEKSFGAYLRLSNASSKMQPDCKGDIRGLAIKLIGVAGDKLNTEQVDATTQDFVLISNETFVSKNVKQFNRAIRAIASNSKIKFILFLLNPLNWGIIIRSAKANIKTGSVLEIPYYSATPYQFGETNRAVKYMCIPRNAAAVAVPANPDDDFLRYQMVSKLSNEDKYFDFFVQFQEDAYKMPIEDPTVKWTSEPVKLATLHIPAQEFDSDVRSELGENLAFSPWHSLPEHRPLGGFNRARRWIYEAMSDFRLSRIDVQNSEPSAINNSTKNNSNTNMSKIQVIQNLYLAFGKGDINSVMSSMDDNIVWLEPGDPAKIPFSGTFTGKADVLKMFGIEQQLLTVTSFNPLTFLENDNTVVVLGNDSAIVKSTGKPYKTDWTMVFTFNTTLVSNVQVYMDTLAIAEAFVPSNQPAS